MNDSEVTTGGARAASNVTGLRCVLCHTVYPEQPLIYTCPQCGMGGILDVEYDYDRARVQMDRAGQDLDQSVGLWRYLPLLPVVPGTRLPSLQCGLTPVYRAPALAQAIGVAELLIKDETRNPTCSFKDRASAVGVVKAVELGFTEVSVASTGNAASSLAGFAANMGLRAHIFVPQRAPEAKVVQLLVFGATVFSVQGTYDQAYDLAMEAAACFGWYNRNCAINAYLVEGKKTCGLELAEQLGGEMPEVLAVAVGDGCTIAGIWKGLREMRELGRVKRIPRLLGVQASGADPLSRAFAAGDEVRTMEARTMADSIAVGQPRNATKAMRAVQQSGGSFISVSDEEIVAAIPLLAGRTGIFAEPAGAACVAGVVAALSRGLIDASERVVCVATGNGLKDIKGAQQSVGAANSISPDLEEVRRVIDSRRALTA